MKKVRTTINHQDERGVIRDILFDQPFEHATLIESEAGVVRGNHYHKESTQYTYVIDGKVEYYYAPGGQEPQVEILEAGEFIVSPPGEAHAIKTLEKTTLLAFNKGPRGGTNYESDTYRLDVPLVS